MRSIPNPQRGCGTLVPGGTYGRGDINTRGGGDLQPWIWTLGEMVMGGRNYTLSSAPRQPQIINLPATLHLQRVVMDALDLAYSAQIDKLPPVALLDHVGSSFYTPFSFAEETQQHGPSRRLSKPIAEAIAPYTPLPIIFCHAWMPVVKADYRAALRDWAGTYGGRRFEPTPDALEWGLEKGDYTGDDHWSIPVMRKLSDDAKGKAKPLASLLDPALAQHTMMCEQLMGISWLTSVVYVTTGNESRADLKPFREKGIEPVQISWDDEE